ncbi:hypothetical protein [Acinetobacter sp. 102]
MIEHLYFNIDDRLFLVLFSSFNCSLGLNIKQNSMIYL